MQPAWQRAAPYVFLAIAVFAVYSNIYDNVFLFDDDLIIRLNTYLRSWDTFGKVLTSSTTGGAHIAGGFYRPIQNLLYFFAFQLNGENPFFFHLLNVSLHIANACLGYGLAKRLGFDQRAALFGMLVWALHPLHTEAVTYMSGTADPLFVMFCLIALNILFPTPTFRRALYCLPFFTLGLLSKETAVVFPALVVVCMLFLPTPTSTARPIKKQAQLPLKTIAIEKAKYILSVTWTFWLITAIYLAWRVTSPDFDGPQRYAQLMKMPAYATLKSYMDNPSIRITTFLATLPAYAKLLVWPVGLHMERSFPLAENLTDAPVLEGLAMLAGSVFIILRSRRIEALRPLSWGLLWFGAAHAPNAGVLFPMNSLFLEHWMYLPSLGLFLGLAQTAMPLIEKIKKPIYDYALLGVAVCLVAALSARTYDQNKIWAEPVIFYTNIFSFGVQSPRAHNNLAIAYMDRHDISDAIEEYRRAIQEGDTYAETHYNYAIALVSMPDQKEHMPQVIRELERSIEIEPGFYRSYMALSQIYAQQGDKDKAAMYQNKAQELLGR